MRELQVLWNSSKAEANHAKHGVSFDEAAGALADPLAVVRLDEKHSSQEDRYILVGESSAARPLTVVFTVRGELARIISTEVDISRKETLHGRTIRNSGCT